MYCEFNDINNAKLKQAYTSISRKLNSACSCNPFIWFLCKLGENEDEPAPFCTRKEGKQTKRLTMNIFLCDSKVQIYGWGYSKVNNSR
jgi:hypothetical protein